MPGGEQLLLDLEAAPALSREDFLVAACNREALAWIERWPDWPAPALVLYGPAGCGKTHLGRIFAARSRAPVLAPGTPLDPDSQPPAPAYVLDPAAPVADERALLGLYNRQRERGGHLLLIAAGPVAQWDLTLADLASRLRAAPATGIGPPDDATLAALLVKLFADRQLGVSEGVIAYLLRRMERSWAAARDVVAGLDRQALSQHKAVTVAMARALLERAEDSRD